MIICLSAALVIGLILVTTPIDDALRSIFTAGLPSDNPPGHKNINKKRT